MRVIISPRDPLIARDGRPFSAAPGARARTLPFPVPQTVAGAVRTAVAQRRGYRLPADADRVRSVGIRGPLLVEETPGGWEFLFPAPADFLLVRDGAVSRHYPLRPGTLLPDETTNLDHGLRPVFPVSDVPVKAKPESPPRFWYRQAFFAWLLEDSFDWREAGHHGPVVDTRLHVRIRPDLGTADEGFLFLTSGLEFVRPRPAGRGGLVRPLSACRRLGLWVDVADEADLTGVRPLGGERRLAAWEPGPPAPEPPDGLLERLLAVRRARVVLLTPAAFRQGFLPGGRSLAGAPVVAVACGRPLVVSGWDLQRRRPKPTRRLVPAGSVYFVEFPPDWGDQEITAWLRRTWFQNVSDDEQDRLDGYGLAAVGVWT